MMEMRYGGNLFLLSPKDKSKNAAYAVTTNGIVKADGKAVMGAGIAKYARDHFMGIDDILGILLRKHGNRPYFLGSFHDAARADKGLRPEIFVVSFPTKNHWAEKSDLELIRASAVTIMKVADSNNLDRIYMPMPGCANGGLDYGTQVRPLIAGLLDDRFTVCVPPDIYDRLG